MPLNIEIEILNSRHVQRFWKSRPNGTAVRQVKILCSGCNRERWISKCSLYKLKSALCRDCIQPLKVAHMNKIQVRHRGQAAHNWRGGVINDSGYRMISIHSDHPFFCMATSTRARSRHKDGKIREHRLVMAEHLGRSLEPWEVVHHKNGDRLDNRIENLELLPGDTEHVVITKMHHQILKLEEENRALRRNCAV